MTQNHPKRNIRTDRSSYELVAGDIKNSLDPYVKMARGRNTVFGMDDFFRGMQHASLSGGSVAGKARADRATSDCKRPTSQWFRDRIATADTHETVETFAAQANAMVAELQRYKILPHRIDIACDKHLKTRYDKSYGPELVRALHRDKAGPNEVYLTIQCVVKDATIILGILPVGMLDTTEELLFRLLGLVDFEIGTIMLDREFFSVRVMKTFDKLGLRYLNPCPNSPRVKKMITEYAAGLREETSEAYLENRDQESVRYFIRIVPRKHATGSKPWDKLVGFASNSPDIDPDQYGSRWVIETGYRVGGLVSPKTRSTEVSARLLCFVYGAIVYNAWIVYNAMLAFMAGIRRTCRSVTLDVFKECLLLFCHVHRPPVPPDRTRNKTRTVLRQPLQDMRIAHAVRRVLQYVCRTGRHVDQTL